MKYIVANFKLNGNSQFIADYCKDINTCVNNPRNLLIALPSPYLFCASKFAKNNIFMVITLANALWIDYTYCECNIKE